MARLELDPDIFPSLEVVRRDQGVRTDPVFGHRFAVHTEDELAAAGAEVASVRAKVTVPVPLVKNASVYGEIENDVVEVAVEGLAGAVVSSL